MRILIITDAWYPQINGVVRTLSSMQEELIKMGNDVRMVTPEAYKTVPCPTYPEIRLSLVTPKAIEKVVKKFMPCAIHIATEGPLGLAARSYCRKKKLPFTTAFHTRFPEYVEARFRIPENWIYPVMRWFHKHSTNVMAPTPTVVENLRAHKFHNACLWGRGVDVDLFKPGPKAALPKDKIQKDKPILLSVGRIAVEKNIAAFLDLDIDANKVVVGDGPMMNELVRKYPDVIFVGAKHGEELVSYYNCADAFIFPSLTDTFGLVMLEALACGTPVAAYPVMGPKDVITDPTAGCLDHDLKTAVLKALGLKREDCRKFAEKQSWKASAETFRSYLHEFDPKLIDRSYVEPTTAEEENIPVSAVAGIASSTKTSD
ncbi:glycosyltransferase family 4 protein [Curvivirga aplysinae]|uniref:glycosyltransferase family 4 protein n=1 Tax=Curvivirga aplysinae TaxID=2529852 RepID=UPI0012BD5135|nr:glycosyltransferase family 1 protein [Curvivirga aplysinae]MTI11462.1 glycosyltransferase family 1 protein [Curvivirga aplysinae]